MDFNIEVRRKQLQSLGQYIKSAEDNVRATLQNLGWNDKKTLEIAEPKVKCPINPNHLITSKSSGQHIKLCQVRSLGYNLNDNFLSEPPETASSSSIKLDNTAKIEILNASRFSSPTFRAAWNGHDPDPMTSSRLFSTFSSDERLAVYNYCTKHTEGPPVPEEFKLSTPKENGTSKELSFEEQLIRERDAKRRRVKYKSVHTSRKSHTEVMRELINNQMELYQDWLHQQAIVQNENGKHYTDDNGYVDQEKPASGCHHLEEGEYVEKPPSPQSSRHSTHSGSSRRHRHNRPRESSRSRRDTRRHSRDERRSRDRRPLRRSHSREEERRDGHRSPRDRRRRSRGRDH